MPLPEKEYFSLEVIAARWGSSVADIEHYATEANLVLSVRVVADVYVQVGWYIADPDGGQLTQPERVRYIRWTVQGLLPDDLNVIFREGETVVHRFQPGAGEDCREIVEDSPVTSITVSRRDLVITRAERDSFEQTHRIEPSVPSKDASRPRAEDGQHVEPERYRSGFPGRPSSKHLIEQEFHSRDSENMCKSTLSAEAQVLHEWLKKEHPDAPTATAKTIRNHIRIEYKRLVRENARN